MDLQAYYQSLEKEPAPKTQFLKEAAKACEVEFTTVRNWVAGKTRPSKPQHEEILSQLSGIPVSELWPEDNK